MAHWLRPQAHRATQALSPPSLRGGAVRLWIKPRPQYPWLRLGTLLLVSLGLSGGALLLVLSFRWGVRWMLDPQALPQWQTWGRPQPPLLTTTLEDWRQAIAAQGLTLGEPLRLSPETGQGGDTLVLIPTLQGETGPITALTLCRSQSVEGRSGDRPLQLTPLTTVTVTTVDRETMLAPLRGLGLSPERVPQNLGLTRLTRLPQSPQDYGLTWLTLEGQWSSPERTWRYGQLLYVDPGQSSLVLLQPWSSPANRLPQWEDLDGEGHADLILDQTLGLEPHFQGFQVTTTDQRGGLMELVPVSWGTIPLTAGSQAREYQIALHLARSGLWREARDRLNRLKPILAERWNPAAEAQRRVIARHADGAHRQAQQDWAMPTQQIVALLIDGQWEEALVRLEANPVLLRPMLRRLEVDQGRLWTRIVAATAVSEPDSALLVWGGLILKARQSNQAAQEWLNRQAIPASARRRLAAIEAMATQPPEPKPVSQGAAAFPATAPAAQSPTVGATVDGLIGTVQGLPTLNLGDWYIPPDQANQAASDRWYRVTVGSVRQSQGWRTNWPGSGQSTADLWLTLARNGLTRLTLLRWTSGQEAMATTLWVRGLMVANGRLTLLATGPAVGPSTLPLLAFSDHSLAWLDRSQWGESAPDGAIAALTTAIFSDQPGSTQAVADLIATVPYSRLDLTGHDQLKGVFSLDSHTLKQLQQLGANLNDQAPKTVILSQDNQVLYSDLFSPQTLIALTPPSPGQPLSLLVYRAGDYALVTGSATPQNVHE